MAVNRFLLCLSISLFTITACSHDPAVQADEEDAKSVGNLVQNSVGNMLDSAQNVMDVVTGDPDEAANVMAEKLPRAWGQDVDTFSGKDIDLASMEDVIGMKGAKELECNFLSDGQKLPVLVAKTSLAADAHPVAVIGNAGMRQRLIGVAPGNIGALASGGVLKGRGVSVAIILKSRVSLTPVGNNSVYPANMKITTDDNRQRIYSGKWVCGF